jgi:phage tail protein X
MERYNNYLFTQPADLDAVNKRRYYQTLIDPTIPKNLSDTYIITVYGDRLDLLASKYYSNSELWWIIAAANPELRKDSMYLDPGMQLRIPADVQSILILFQNQNISR